MRVNEKYEFRLLCLQLISRLMGRHELLLLNFYPCLLKYITPKQREIAGVLACLAQSCHSLVPPQVSFRVLILRDLELSGP